MADRSTPCRYFAKGNCRFGTRCKHSHDLQRVGSPASASTSSQSQAQRASKTQGSPGNRVPGVPPRVCNVFWMNGSCSRGFECSYKHERQPVASSRTLTVDHNPEQQEEDTLDFFSAEGLAINNGSIREERHTLSPSEAHNHIKLFLADNYTFENASRIQGFVRILASVNDRNKTWNSENAQAFLDMIVKGNGILRIGDILRFKPVGYKIGYGSGTLSFQKGYFPVFEYLASNLVLKSTLHKNINHLYTVLENNYEDVRNAIKSAMDNMIQARTWKDTTSNLNSSLQNSLDGVVIFKTLTTVLYQYFNRFKDAVKNHPDIVHLVGDLSDWFNTWSTAVSTSPSSFVDPISSSSSAVRVLTLNKIREDVSRLNAIVQRESDATERARRRTREKAQVSPAERRQALLAQLSQTYDPPGALRADGPRHDNDFEDISRIRVAPTHDELLCAVPPYLPVFLSDAQHHLPAQSMQRHLDIQFRLLREELIATTRSSIAVIHEDLLTMWQHPIGRGKKKREYNKVEQILAAHGGTYRTSGYDSVFFQIYTGVEFSPIKTDRRDLTVGLVLDPPNLHAARDPDWRKRHDYWQHSKRLQSGSLVALVIVAPRMMRVFLGVISSFSQDIAESAKASAEAILVQVKFFDAEVELMALRHEAITIDAAHFAMLIDNGVMFDAIRPFLERLQTIEPTEIPFARYIAHGDPLKEVQMHPPRYATVPTFRYRIDCLAKPGMHDRIQPLNINFPNAIVIARQQLLEAGILDPSQVEAVLNTLCREKSLIQGPPGTGKSYTAKNILRVLFESKIRPIVLIAYTNHALDHMLTSVLEDKITTKLVRLGSRSSSERIGEYTLDKLEKASGGAGMLDRPVRRQYAIMKKLEENIKVVMDSIQLPSLKWAKIEEYLDIHHPGLAKGFREPPFWIAELTKIQWADEDKEGEWKTAGKGKNVDSSIERTLYGFWRDGRDIAWIQPPTHVVKPAEKQLPPAVIQLPFDPVVIDFFTNLGFGPQVPPLPRTSRSVDTLLESTSVWSMSLTERESLAAELERRIRQLAYRSHLDRYEELREEYKEACAEYNDMKDEVRRRLLSNMDLIGCTTTGAARLISLLNSIGPKVLMVEEAGQVLEAHIITSLVSSVNHLICIGDPQQLRPNLATFSLSMDSERGRQLYKFDRSLMERLADAGLPMSQINVQRRMRPTISHFIRQILYPRLEDNEVVLSYPHVQGIQKDVFFFSHTNKEGGVDDSVSKYNNFEVLMIRDLVMYLLRQGIYNVQGDIAVLCAYLGQLQKVKAALKDMKIAVSVDERDQEQLARQGIDEDVEFEEVMVTKHVRLGTVDIFQGQEAKVVIVSLVRNTGTFETGGASIGFLKSSNRINVALSRAKHGLYIFGNAANLRKSETWSTIIDDMEARDQIGHGLPIICPRHPAETQFITTPGELDRLAPAGGCLLPCNFRLQCGHICPSMCHAAIDNHRMTQCNQPCNRTPCPRLHPCQRRCHEDCGKCNFPIYNVALPCGHRHTVPCHTLDALEAVKCHIMVTKKLPQCEHEARVQCSRDPRTVSCQEPCGGSLSCCSKTCKARCSACLRETTIAIPNSSSLEMFSQKVIRTKHLKHPCDRVLYCQHLCGLDCSQDHDCNSQCSQTCRQRCLHNACKKPCSEPCPPCMEVCAWSCPHHTCPVACGSICARLPCDEPCTRELACGHPCPSVCGEICAQQVCVICLPEERKTNIVDFIMQRRLDEIDLTSTDISERLITLDCGHTFTVETLDGHCNMPAFYEVDASGCYLSTKAPPIDYQSPPTCPTCRGPITSLRYGRVTKRATLDILEQNVASNMSRALDDMQPTMKNISADMETFQETAKKLESSLADPLKTSSKPKPDGKSAKPLSADQFGLHCMQNVHGISSKEAKAWLGIVKNIVAAYRRVVKVAVTRGAHVKAYEAALTTLYRLEIEAIANDPERATDAPEEMAFAAVNVKIGQPPHKADTRFQVEAFFLSVEIRFMLAQIVTSRVEGLPSTSEDTNVVQHRQRWTAYLEFILQSCLADSRKALLIAHKASASRQTTRAALYILRSEFEQFRAQVLEERLQAIRQGQFKEETRNKLVEKVKAKSTYILNFVEQSEREYLRSRPSKTTKDLKEQRTWFTENCRRKAQRWRDECAALEKSITTDTFYQPMSLQEKEDIVKAFEFSHRGHFYNCMNGHTFVITECGGAMQAAQCPECNAPIGGGDHRLDSSNTRATEFEAIAGRMGSLPGVWAWARDA